MKPGSAIGCKAAQGHARRRACEVLIAARAGLLSAPAGVMEESAVNHVLRDAPINGWARSKHGERRDHSLEDRFA
jgi:hypothetical protein